ncbi:MAG: prefoldin subunit [Promethearchaeota archaeon]
MQNPPQYNFTPDQQKEILGYQQTQQQLEAYTQQLSTTELQLKDISYSIVELEKADEEAVIYKAIGSLFVKKTKSNILESSKSEKETLDLRLVSLKSHVSKLKAQFEKERIKIEEIFKTQGYKT